MFDIGIHSILFERIFSKKYFEEKSADEITKKADIYKVLFAQNYAQQLRF